MEFLIAIAALCNVNHAHSQSTVQVIQKRQLSCQKYYINCYKKNSKYRMIAKIGTSDLANCVLSRNIK